MFFDLPFEDNSDNDEEIKINIEKNKKRVNFVKSLRNRNEEGDNFWPSSKEGQGKNNFLLPDYAFGNIKEKEKKKAREEKK